MVKLIKIYKNFNIIKQHKRSIILIGGEGYIGTVVRNFFLKKKFKVNSIDNVIYKQSLKIDKSNKNFKFIKYDFANKKIFNFLDKMHYHTKVIYTCSVRSYDFFVDYLSENSKTFTFLWQDKSPYSSGIIIDKTRNSYTVSKNIVTSHTDLIVRQ